jgi:phosphohistidine phosphatase
MKIVSAVRHAKSDWNTEHPDIHRPLNTRGLKNAPLMGRRLVERGIAPDLLITSPAVRAHTTADLIAAELGYPPDDVERVNDLYGADADTMLTVLSALPDSVEHVMFFSHNPGITHFVNTVTDASIENIPTCGIVEIEFSVDSWSQIGESRGRFIHFDYPKK